LRRASAIGAFVGPEGGWTENETRAVLDAGAQPVYLGPHTLRIETAAIVLAGLMHVMQTTEH
jgi:16S rRNA (uracil1498-N3)-methyltransferase